MTWKLNWLKWDILHTYYYFSPFKLLTLNPFPLIQNRMW
jgi:hypothetical protein